MKIAKKISYKENTLSLLKNLTTKELIIQVEFYVSFYNCYRMNKNLCGQEFNKRALRTNR